MKVFFFIFFLLMMTMTIMMMMHSFTSAKTKLFVYSNYLYIFSPFFLFTFRISEETWMNKGSFPLSRLWFFWTWEQEMCSSSLRRNTIWPFFFTWPTLTKKLPLVTQAADPIYLSQHGESSEAKSSVWVALVQPRKTFSRMVVVVVVAHHISHQLALSLIPSHHAT